MASKPRRFPDESELQRADTLVEMAIASGCWRCNRRLVGQDIELRGQVICPKKQSTLGFVILCDICVAYLYERGKL